MKPKQILPFRPEILIAAGIGAGLALGALLDSYMAGFFIGIPLVLLIGVVYKQMHKRS